MQSLRKSCLGTCANKPMETGPRLLPCVCVTNQAVLLMPEPELRQALLFGNRGPVGLASTMYDARNVCLGPESPIHEQVFKYPGSAHCLRRGGSFNELHNSSQKSTAPGPWWICCGAPEGPERK